MLFILIHQLKEKLGYYLTIEALLYSLLVDKLNISKTKDQNKVEKLNQLLKIINSDTKLSKLLKDMKELKKDISNTYAIQSVIRITCKNFKAYRKAYEEYLKEPSKFNGVPKPPKPKKLKNIDRFTVELNKLSFKILNGILHIKLHNGKKVKVKMPKYLINPSSVRITYYLGFAFIDIVFDKYIEELNPLFNHKAGIDLGVENFITLVSNGRNIPSLVIKSAHLKSYNQWFNKLLASLRSELDLLRNEYKENKNDELLLKIIELERRIKNLYLDRKKWMENLVHQIAKALALYLHRTGHDCVYVGNNLLEAKQCSNMSKKNNQNFIQIPFRLFLDKLVYKLQWFGIKLYEVDESWTSKSSCISDDVLKIQRKFRKILKLDDDKEKGKQIGILKNSMSGVRFTRSLFKDTKINKVLHADVNGAFNILKVGLKAKELFNNLDSKVIMKLCNPIKNNIFKFCEFVLNKATSEPFYIEW